MIVPIKLLELEPEFILSLTNSRKIGIYSPDYREKRKRVLEKCFEEDKWFLSESIEVGLGVAEEHFLDYIFAGWDDGFFAAYQYRKENRVNTTNEKTNCSNREFMEAEFVELSSFLEKYRKSLNGQLDKEVSESEAFEHFNARYLDGWRTGWRAGFCGCSCTQRGNCYIAEKYLVD